jgi:hypothetical protein
MIHRQDGVAVKFKGNFILLYGILKTVQTATTIVDK